MKWSASPKKARKQRVWRDRPDPDGVEVAGLGRGGGPWAIVGGSELISRYRDAPEAALRTWPALFYLGLNGAACLGVLGLIYASRGRLISA
jgi:hypothetical protein